MGQQPPHSSQTKGKCGGHKGFRLLKAQNQNPPPVPAVDAEPQHQLWDQVHGGAAGKKEQGREDVESKGTSQVRAERKQNTDRKRRRKRGDGTDKDHETITMAQIGPDT